MLAWPARTMALRSGKQQQRWPDVQVVTALSLIHQPAARVRDIITRYHDYAGIMPGIESANIINKTADGAVVDYRLTVRAGLLRAHKQLRLQHSNEEGDIITRSLDNSAPVFSRWEIRAVDNATTMLAYSHWTEPGNAVWLERWLMGDDERMQRTTPVLSAAAAVRAVRLCAEVRCVRQSEKRPVLSSRNSSDEPGLAWLYQRMAPLVAEGDVYWIHNDGNSQQAQHVLALSRIPAERCERHTASQMISSLPAVTAMSGPIHFDGDKVGWSLAYPMGMLRITLEHNFQLQYGEDQSITLLRTKGDLKRFDLQFDCHRTHDKQALLLFGNRLAIGERPPFALRMLNGLPQLSLSTSLFLAVNMLHDQKEWLMRVQ